MNAGICIGEISTPAFGTAWNAIGRITQSADRAAVIMIFLISVIILYLLRLIGQKQTILKELLRVP